MVILDVRKIVPLHRKDKTTYIVVVPFCLFFLWVVTNICMSEIIGNNVQSFNNNELIIAKPTTTFKFNPKVI